MEKECPGSVSVQCDEETLDYGVFVRETKVGEANVLVEGVQRRLMDAKNRVLYPLHKSEAARLVPAIGDPPEWVRWFGILKPSSLEPGRCVGASIFQCILALLWALESTEIWGDLGHWIN